LSDPILKRIGNRSTIATLLASLFCLSSGGAWAQGSLLTEAEAVGRGLARAEVNALLETRRQIAAGNTRAAGRWSNPEIEYSRESVDLPGGEGREKFLWIRQRLNVAGVHGLEREAAAALEVAAGARAEIERRGIAADIRRLYYSALAAEAQLRTALRWQGRLDQLADSVSQRVAAGDASRYDLLRIEREFALLRGEVLDREAAAESARDRLFSLIGGQPAALSGQVLPPAVGESAVADVVAEHPLLSALDAEADSASLSARAAGRRTWPEVTVGVGRREVEEPGLDANGNLVMLGLEVPLFDRGDGEEFAAESRARRLDAERRMAANRLTAETRAAVRAVEAGREAAQLLQAADAEEHSLASIAESAYAAGEIGVMELIDAHRADLAAQREAIERAQSARESFIELQFLRGEP